MYNYNKIIMYNKIKDNYIIYSRTSFIRGFRDEKILGRKPRIQEGAAFKKCQFTLCLKQIGDTKHCV